MTRPSRRSVVLAALGAGLAARGAVAVAGGAVAAAAPTSAAAAPVRAARRRVPRVFVAGDSTAALWPADVAPKAGWGQALPAFLKDTCFVVDDRAVSGASSKSWIEELGKLDPLAADLRRGDYLLVSFGHNDAKTDARGTDPATTFPEYLTRYVRVALAAGAHPVLVTPVERRRFDAAGAARSSHGAYPQAVRDLGDALAVPVVDLTTSSMALWNTLGVEGTKRAFLWMPAGSANFPAGVEDNTHFQAHGAIEVARLVVAALVKQHILPSSAVRRLDDAVPDNALVWPATV